MPKSLDLMTITKEQLGEQLMQAMQAEDTAAAAKAMAEFSEGLQQSIIQEAMSMTEEQLSDTNALAARGVRQLTKEEKSFYTQLSTGLSKATQAITNLEIAMPTTVIDAVFDDMVQEHPLLNIITFQNTNGAIKMIVNKGGIQLAVWGPLTGPFKTELSGSIEEINTSMYKLQAFIPVAKAMLDLGPAWLDRYVRTILTEAVAWGIEAAIISGTGKDEPIGINRIVGKDAVVSDGVYSEKEAVPVTSFDPASYGELASMLATHAETGLMRRVENLVLIVSPVDYLKVVMPATTILTPSGTYARDVLPMPTTVVQSQQCPVGTAYLGLAKRYFMALGSPKQGQIEYDDSVEFMEDRRIYAVRLYGNGMPLDNNAFIKLDITGLKPARYAVTTFAESMDEGDTP